MFCKKRAVEEKAETEAMLLMRSSCKLTGILKLMPGSAL